ncbi:MAG: TolC family protein [Bacteroidales bacterium]|nr:TolC family protein [Bacteroidales bacterium]
MRKKKNKYIIIGIISCIALFQSVSVYSQDSLMHYLELATKNNPTVLQRYNEYQAALQKVPQVGSLPDPQLEMGVFLSPMELMSGNQVADIKLMQMFPWFGVLKNAKDEMSLMAKAKYETFTDAKLQVFYEVQSIWYDLYKIRRNMEISQENIALLKTIESLSVIKFKSASISGGPSSEGGNMPKSSTRSATGSSSGMGGMGGNSTSSGKPTPINVFAAGGTMNSPMSSTSTASSLSDVYRIQMEIGDLENSIALLKNEEQVILSKFNSLLNRSLNTPVLVSNLLPSEPLNIAYLSVADSMFTRNPMLNMLRYDQQSLDARKKMQKKMGLPMLGLGLNYSVISKSEMSTSPMNGDDMIMPMFTVTLPVYRKKYKAMQTEISFLKAASEQNYQATANALQTEYYETLQLYYDAQRRMKLYENQSKLAQKSLDIMIKTFSSSAADMTDILEIRQQLLAYELNQVEALVDFNKSVAWVKRLVNN